MYNSSEPESDKIDLIAFGVDESVFFKVNNFPKGRELSRIASHLGHMGERKEKHVFTIVCNLSPNLK